MDARVYRCCIHVPHEARGLVCLAAFCCLVVMLSSVRDNTTAGRRLVMRELRSHAAAPPLPPEPIRTHRLQHKHGSCRGTDEQSRSNAAPASTRAQRHNARDDTAQQGSAAERSKTVAPTHALPSPPPIHTHTTATPARGKPEAATLVLQRRHIQKLVRKSRCKRYRCKDVGQAAAAMLRTGA